MRSQMLLCGDSPVYDAEMRGGESDYKCGSLVEAKHVKGVK
jgi:hypothetical protein